MEKLKPKEPVQLEFPWIKEEDREFDNSWVGQKQKEYLEWWRKQQQNYGSGPVTERDS
jgi:hypothetical protein